eukprot:15325995-Ditylum_brightwellii.AAC.1
MSTEYIAIEQSNRKIAVVHHLVETLVLTSIFPVFTYNTIIVNFQVHEEVDKVLSALSAIAKF